MPESTVELLKRAVDAQAKVINKPVPDKRELEDDTEKIKKGRRESWE